MSDDDAPCDVCDSSDYTLGQDGVCAACALADEDDRRLCEAQQTREDR